MPLFLFNCTVIKQPPPAAGPVTFKIYEPANYNCYTLHQGSGVPAIKIKLHFNLKTQYINPGGYNTDFVEYDDKSIDFDPSIDTWPLTIILNSPAKNVWYCEVIILGTECSECAIGYGDQTEVSGMCGSQTYIDNSTNPATITYQGAKPMWGDRFTFRNVLTTADIRPKSRVPNILGSCGLNCRIH